MRGLFLIIGLAAFRAVGVDLESEVKCFDNRITLWGQMRAHCLERNINFTNTIGVTALNEWPRWMETHICPSTGQEYSPFSFVDGPRCPNGHLNEGTFPFTEIGRYSQKGNLKMALEF